MKPLYFLLLCFTFGRGYAQVPESGFVADSLIETERLYSGIISLEGIATSDKQVPFWMRSNQFGSMPLSGLSSSLITSYKKTYNTSHTLADWGFGAEGRVNVGKQGSFQLIEAYVKGRFSIFQLKAGRAKNITGLVDSTLSCGAFSLSGNALGIPQIELSVPEYWSIPLTRGVLSFKGNFVHGWAGKYDLRTQNSRVSSVNAFIHQKSLYGRLGKESWKVKLYGGFNHQVMWGGERKINGSAYKLTDAKTFLYVVTGKAYGTKGVPTSKIGNHIGSIDQAIEITFKKINVLAYHQFFYEVGGLYHFNNLKDGLWGLSITNRHVSNDNWGWRKLLVEIWNSTSQGGEADAKPTPSGDEDYYNNYIYASGWTYMGENLGNPLLTGRKYARSDLPSRGYQYIINNRVSALNIGMEGYYGGWDAKLLLTYSRNYGTWGSNPVGSSGRGMHYPGPPPYFEEVSQFSGFLEASRPIGNGFRLGFALALDQGQLLYNSFGGYAKLSKSF